MAEAAGVVSSTVAGTTVSDSAASFLFSDGSWMVMELSAFTVIFTPLRGSTDSEASEAPAASAAATDCTGRPASADDAGMASPSDVAGKMPLGSSVVSSLATVPLASSAGAAVDASAGGEETTSAPSATSSFGSSSCVLASGASLLEAAASSRGAWGAAAVVAAAVVAASESLARGAWRQRLAGISAEPSSSTCSEGISGRDDVASNCVGTPETSVRCPRPPVCDAELPLSFDESASSCWVHLAISKPGETRKGWRKRRPLNSSEVTGTGPPATSTRSA
mmetsp:Transcript_58325/g.126075  ORF Transcript_58325/g.126075 Transcript_58325/m.126075 type:complete len:279 (-) Transcript_58325:229-1065(-)